MEPYLKIRGGGRLWGEITVGGMKNAALPILFATLLVRGAVTLENLPPVTDVETALAILCAMGARVERLSPTSVRIDTGGADPDAIPDDLATRLRGSSYLLGAGLGRFGRVRMAAPGGCDFGERPLDQHFRILRAMGAVEKSECDTIAFSAPNGLHGAAVPLSFPSVGATVNGILAAALADGVTLIENAAREPHVADLAAFLNACGASVTGAGTPTVRVRGASVLHGCRYRIVPDMIEAGTYLAAVTGTGGRIRLRSAEPLHLAAVTEKLTAMGATVSVFADSILLSREITPLRGTDIETMPYPDFPTDMHPQFAPLLAMSRGGGCICERVWENRFGYVPELRRMGAGITRTGRCAVFSGGDRLVGARVAATDLRAGAAMILAGLCAEGTTEVTSIHRIARGYPDYLSKFRALGAEIETVGP